MIFESSGVEKNFDSVIEDLNKVKLLTLTKIKELENANDIKKIERLAPLYIDSLKVSTWIDSGIYADRRLKIRIDGSKELFELLNAQPEIKSGISKYRDLNFLIMSMSEEEEVANKAAFKSFIDALTAVDESTHKDNLQRVENNRQTERSIFNLLERIGIRSKYYGYASKRSSKQTEQYHNFPSEIRGQIPTNYSEGKLDQVKSSLVKSFNELYDRELKKIRDARIQKEKEEADRRRNKKLALLLAKYDLDLDSEWEDILSVMIEKNKYLRLAYYLEENRCDWNDGDWYARRGLDGFAIETEMDQAIYNNISSYCGEGWQFDGRVFRDCKYNYSVLYGMAQEQDKSLYDDYCEVKENIED